MSFKSKIKRKGNELISQYSSNPYYVNKVEKKRIPLWAKISLPSSLIVVGAIAAIVITNSLGSKYDMSTRQINNPNKIYNSAHNELDPSYIKSVKEFTSDLFLKEYAFYSANKEHTKDNPNRDSFEKGNLIFSPLPMINQLYMTYDAIEGNGKELIKQVLHYDGFDHLIETQKAIKNMLINQQYCYSEISNSLFVVSDLAQYLKDDYINLLTNYYFADVFSVEDMAKDEIPLLHNYIGNKKRAHLSDLNSDIFTEDLLESNSNEAPLFNNADMYCFSHLEALWDCEFIKDQATAIFYNQNGTTSEISYIKTRLITDVFEGETYRIIRIPLSHYSFNILIQKEYQDDDSLSNLVNDLLPLNFTHKYRADVSFKMPSFSYSNPSYLSSLLLRHLGLDTLLDEEGIDYSGAFESYGNKGGLGFWMNFLSSIEINEYGVSAYSQADNDNRSEPTATEEVDVNLDVNVDHPFIYSITDSSGLPLYLGQILEM